MASWPSCSTNGQKYCFWLYFGYHGKILKDLKFFKESKTRSWFLVANSNIFKSGWVDGESLIPLFKIVVQIGELQPTFQIQRTLVQKDKLLLVGFKALQIHGLQKDFRSVLKVYIRPLVLIVRHWKIFRSDIEREKVKYPFKRKPCNWESPKLSKFYL